MSTTTLLRAVVLLAAAVFCVGWADWPAFRYDVRRTAAQPEASPLSDPQKVKNLKCVWRFPKIGDPHICDGKEPDICDGFRASPVVYKGLVFIGNGNGYFYALNANTGNKLWQYPPAGSKALLSKFTSGHPSSRGIASSATIAKIRGRDAVIFAAPNPNVGKGLGDGCLFALDIETGKEIWVSPVIARLTGLTRGDKKELHENLGHSSPLVLGEKIYIGVGDHADSPVQQGKVVAVKLETGQIVPQFTFCSTGVCGDGTRGGGVWSPPAGWRNEVYVTTGNTKSEPDLEPDPNHGLSLLRLDAARGRIVWKFQPVPWEIDADPDWSAAPTVMSTSCGLLIVSTQKDGWTHALDAANGSRRWSFPPHTIPFAKDDGTVHGDSRYMRSGAAWRDVYVAVNGGLNLKPTDVTVGYHRLHAFNVCEPEDLKKQLRWLIDVPDTCRGDDCLNGCSPPGPCCRVNCRYCLGNPTISGGIVYVGTNRGHLLAIADPDVVPTRDSRCENPDLLRDEDCLAMRYRLVPRPKILANVKLTGSMSYTEPALANGRVYVATDIRNADDTRAGYVYMLQPSNKEELPCDPP